VSRSAPSVGNCFITSISSSISVTTKSASSPTSIAANSNTTLIFAEVTKVAYGWDETASEQGYRTMSLSSPGLKITDARVRVIRLNRCSLIGLDRDGAYRFSDCFGIHPLKLGVDVLKKVRIYMAVKAERMYVSAWDAQ